MKSLNKQSNTMSLGAVLGATALEKAEKALTGKEKENTDGQD